MKLLSLELAGFKSFAEPTEFKFDSGVTGIVGPNGCGKSNIVDAVKWVLGEMSAKSLRGDAMLDVIFNGSGGRKPMSMAEVSLVFSNENHRLPLESEQVKITRRLYRDATSEYLVNNQTARLKDIRELFLDTGVGVDAYSVIEQGRVAALLDSDSLSRRDVFEEAAGISRFKTRKKETLRRLEKTDQNLAQAQLVLAEVERQLRSVKVQAGRARSYQEYAGRLRELRRSQSLYEYDQLHRRLSEVGRQRADAADSAAHHRRRLESCRREQQDMQLEIDALQNAARRAERELAARENQRQSLEQQSQFHRREADQLAQQLAALERRRGEMNTRREQVRVRIDQLAAALDGAERQVKTDEELLTGAGARHESAALRITGLNHQVEQDKARAVDVLRETARFQSELNSLVVQRENMDRQITRLDARGAELAAQLAEVQTQMTQLARRRDELAGLSESLQAEVEQVRRRQQANNQRMAELLEELARKREQRSALESRRSVLADLQRRREGASQAVREVLKQRDEGKGFAGVKGMVGDLLDAELETAALIEAALGETLHALVVEDSSTLAAQIDAWRRIGGRARVICLDRLEAYREDIESPAAQAGAVRAIDLVRYDPAMAPLALRLLGRTFVVDQWSDALSLWARGPRNYRYVTRAGEVLNPDSTMELGGAARGHGAIARRSELNHLLGEMTAVEAQIQSLAAAGAECDQESQSLATRQQTLRDQLYQAQTEHAQVDAQWRQAGQTVDRVQAEIPLVRTEADQLRGQVRETDQKQNLLRDQVASLETEGRALEQTVRDRLAQLQTQREELAKIAEKMTGLRVALGQAQEQRAAAARELSATRQFGADLETQRERLEAEAASLEQRIDEATRAADKSQEQALEVARHQQAAQQDVQSNADQMAALRQRYAGMNEQIGEFQKQVDAGDRQEHDLSLAENELSVRLETLVERVGEELQINLVDLHKEYQPDESVNHEAAAAEINDLRNRMARLGNVNLEAINELDQLEQRQKFLAAQIADILDAKSQLAQLIAKIDEDSRSRFSETFETVRKEFQEMFRKLFGGGKADAILENPQDILESGIEILARPPGKELQSISLLSGGERALTALALVLAIFRSKPSPFCILDEVDAPLDEANTGRFAAIIKEFLVQSQFILITHNKRMMTVADILYGVTMQEPGVSKKVAVRFDRGAASEAASPAAVAAA